jgi:aspartate/methionine/tyrosine aminotransferase
MNNSDRVQESVYMEWAKTRASAKFNLATSGVENYPIKEFPVVIEDIELSGPSWYGYEPLQKALAAKCRAEIECVVAATGCSMANHLAMAAILNPGDEVLIERPTYDPLIAVAGYLGAGVRRFERRFEDGFRIDPDEVERAITPRTRLIVLTNMHNPSGVFTDDSTLSRIGEIAKKVGARVLVDEVYLETIFEGAPLSAFHLGRHFITTSSLTKAYGLSGLRCGWALAEPELAKKMWRINDLFGVIPAHPAERLSVIALANIDRISDRARWLLEANRPLVNRFLDSQQNLSVVRPDYGTVLFPRLLKGNVDSLCELLRHKYDTSVVPGRFFEMPAHFRIGIGCTTETLTAGLEKLGTALEEMR